MTNSKAKPYRGIKNTAYIKKQNNPQKLFRCRWCSKPLREENKSGFCSHCGTEIQNKLKTK